MNESIRLRPGTPEFKEPQEAVDAAFNAIRALMHPKECGARVGELEDGDWARLKYIREAALELIEARKERTWVDRVTGERNGRER